MWVQVGNFYFLLPPLVLSMIFAYTCYMYMHVGMPEQALEWLPLGLEFFVCFFSGTRSFIFS